MVRPVIRVPAYESDDGMATFSFGGPGSFNGGASGSDAAAAAGGQRPKPFSKVPSLLFDLDLEETSALKPSPDQATDPALASVLSALYSLVEPWSEAEYMLLMHVRLAREDAAKRMAPLTVPDLADTLRRLGYSVKIRTALGGGWGGACLRNLRHTFLTVDLASQGGTGHLSYILDPKFREQFEVAHPTPRYKKIMEGLTTPEVLATPDRLTKVVELLCNELARAFAETGTPLPPWRQTAAMLSKWQPRRSEDIDVVPNPSSYLNNALGVLSAAASGGGSSRPGLPPRPQQSSSAARRLAAEVGALEPVPWLGPSPISEGLEPAGESLPSESSSPRSLTSSGGAGSVHLGWPAEMLGLEEGPAAPAAQAAVASPQLRRRSSEVVTVHLSSAKPSVQHPVWEGIQRAAAALPRQPYTWT